MALARFGCHKRTNVGKGLFIAALVFVACSGSAKLTATPKPTRREDGDTPGRRDVRCAFHLAGASFAGRIGPRQAATVFETVGSFLFEQGFRVPAN